jgi:hypothetical protein
MMLVVDLLMLAVGLLLLAGGYAVWFTQHEDPWPRANYSFIYLIPGWALTTMGYVGWRIRALGAAGQDSQNRESA